MADDAEKAMEVVNNDDDHESVDDEEDDDSSPSKTRAGTKINPQFLQDPNLMRALQSGLDGMVGTPSGYIESLPAPVKRRLKALKKLQLDATKLEAKFYQEIHLLECKYHSLYTPLYEKRTQISKGDYEPNDEECEWPSDDEEGEEDEAKGDEKKLSENMKEKAKLEDGEKEDKEKDAKGIPEFWLTIFKNVDLLQDMVQEHDEEPLKALQDITVTFTEEPMSFKLHFHFSPNDYFTDSVLTKHYDLKCEPSEDDPFSFEGPEITRCSGCPIAWKPGKNLTVKTVKKKQKHKSKNTVRTVSKQMKNDSFFNFFDPPAIPEDEADLDEDTQELLTTDFEIGHYIRERIVPRAVLYFTGEALDDDDDYEEEEEEEGEEEEDDDDPDFDPSKAKKPGDGSNPQECKQQ